jgi:hypothetical protein
MNYASKYGMCVRRWNGGSYLVERVSSHNKFSTCSFKEGLKFLYSNTPWSEEPRENSFEMSVDSLI